MSSWEILPLPGLALHRRRSCNYSRRIKLGAWFKGKKLHWSLYLALASLGVGGLLGWHDYLAAHFFVLRIDGDEAGLVRDAVEMELFIDDLIKRCGSLYGMEVNAAQEITLTREFRPGREANARQAEEALRQQLRLVTEATMIMVDGVPLVPVYREEEIETVVELLSLAYIGEDDDVKLLEVELVEELSGEKCVVPPEQVYKPEEVALLLRRPTQSESDMVASAGVLLSRHGRHGEPEHELPVVHVITVEETLLEERIPFTTTYTSSDSMYIGESRVVTPGEDGLKEVTYRITRENGVEIEREPLAEEVIQEPVTRVVERGTKRRFGWPVAGGGRISQYFKGRAHMGIDIAAPSGTPILAAEGGTVIRSTYAYPMGNYIVLYHGGYWTVYLHNSKNLVSTGQKVSRGQTIAYLGSTGHSTGPHLHFEIRVNNGSGVWSGWYAHKAINPLQFY